MVLDKLGSSLKETLKKITQAIFVDEKLIEELIKDLQRALLFADVNVKLVFELTKKIKERALDEKVHKSSSQRENLIRIVYDELVAFLGDEKSEIIIKEKKPLKIMMVGVYGSGKCVHPNTNILMKNGDSIKIKDLYDNFSKTNQSLELEDGAIIDISNQNLILPSFNPKTLKIENKKTTHIWKLKGKELFDIHLDNGNDFNVKVTPEHPFFVLRDGNILQKKADQLSEDDYIAVPNSLPYNEAVNINLFNDLKNLNLDVYLNNVEAKEKILLKYKTLKEAQNNLIFRRNYCKFTSNVKRGRIPIQFVDEINESLIKIKLNLAKDKIYFPHYLNKDLAELLGYLIGDGYLDKSYLHFSNQDDEIIERINHLCKTLFGINPKIRRDFRRKKLKIILLTSKTLVTVFNKIFKIPIGKKRKFLKIPNQILTSDKEVLRSFLRAYFDCDSYPIEDSRQIELSSESRPLIVDTYYSLLKFGILSTISKKYSQEIRYWSLTLSAKYAEKYTGLIGFNI